MNHVSRLIADCQKQVISAAQFQGFRHIGTEPGEGKKGPDLIRETLEHYLIETVEGIRIIAFYVQDSYYQVLFTE